LWGFSVKQRTTTPQQSHQRKKHNRGQEVPENGAGGGDWKEPRRRKATRQDYVRILVLLKNRAETRRTKLMRDFQQGRIELFFPETDVKDGRLNPPSPTLPISSLQPLCLSCALVHETWFLSRIAARFCLTSCERLNSSLLCDRSLSRYQCRPSSKRETTSTTQAEASGVFHAAASKTCGGIVRN
jgi:hypothetical protein